MCECVVNIATVYRKIKLKLDCTTNKSLLYSKNAFTFVTTVLATLKSHKTAYQGESFAFIGLQFLTLKLL